MITEWKLKKISKVHAIMQDVKKGMKKKEACEKHSMPYPTYRRWEKQYEVKGEKGLLDRRRGTRPRKVTGSVRQRIIEKRRRDASLSAQEIADQLTSEGTSNVSGWHVCRILREEGLNKHRGRVWGKKTGPYRKRAR